MWEELVVEGPPLWQAIFWCGTIVSLVAGAWMLFCAFEEGVGWGIALIIMPIMTLFFVVKFWDKARAPFGASLVGLALIFLPQKFATDSSAPAPEQADAPADIEVYGGGQVYRYTDRFGRTHLTNDPASVPEEYRSKLEPILD